MASPLDFYAKGTDLARKAVEADERKDLKLARQLYEQCLDHFIAGLKCASLALRGGCRVVDGAARSGACGTRSRRRTQRRASLLSSSSSL